MGNRLMVAKAFLHKWEEPCISGTNGSGTVFFSGCNLKCIFCQNYAISQQCFGKEITVDKLGDIFLALQYKGAHNINLVNPTHFAVQIREAILGIKDRLKIPVVYNSNGYDKVETLKTLEGIIDVYLPDFKYLDANLAKHYSQAGDYPEVASAAIKEMYRQKGSTLIVNEKGIAEWGIVLRHLVLPGAVPQSIEVLRYVAEEISPNLHISLMSQYYPTPQVKDHPLLNRTISAEEYQQVVDAMYELGFHKGWTQELGSHASYRPDFSGEQPFEDPLSRLRTRE
jgi:putative pyruvate formate lyase activating enzyme